MTSERHLKTAWQALLRGDLTERDRQCELAKQAIEDEKAAAYCSLLEIDFFVTSRGIVVPAISIMGKA